MMLPVYLFTGFLDAGKTQFIQHLLEDPAFNQGERTLLLLCEEGEQEYERERFNIDHVTVSVVTDIERITPQQLSAMQSKAMATRILIEYNGMWMLDELFDRLPETWGIARETLFFDASTVWLYNQNMRSLVVDKLRTAELVVFNRVADGQDRMELHKLVRGISRSADILYETADGRTEEDTFPDPLPFDLDAPIVDIGDDDYALFYRDLVEEPKKYEGKTVRYLGLVGNPPRIPKDTLLVGRQIMECCADDITYCPLVCRYEGARAVPHKSWAVVTGKLSIRFSNLYGKKGPVLTVTSLVPADEPSEPVATFY